MRKVTLLVAALIAAGCAGDPTGIDVPNNTMPNPSSPVPTALEVNQAQDLCPRSVANLTWKQQLNWEVEVQVQLNGEYVELGRTRDAKWQWYAPEGVEIKDVIFRIRYTDSPNFMYGILTFDCSRI